VNPEAQRIAIASLQGWVEIEPYTKAKALHGRFGKRGKLEEIPNYLHDLNAIHSAAKAECERRGWVYSVHYRLNGYICCFHKMNEDQEIEKRFSQVFNPDQCAALAEALLKACNLWTE